MRNIINEKPSEKLTGRILACANFVDDRDIAEKKILDIGCGYGWCEINFLNRGAKEITGMDISENDLETIRKNVKSEKANFVVSGATDLPFKDEYFNTVVSWDVIEHIPKGTEYKMFSDVCRVLKSGGYFYLSTPYTSFFSNIMDPAWWIAGHRHYSEKELTSYAKNNKFEVISVETRGNWWVLFSILNMYIAKWIFRRKPFFEDELRKREDAEYVKNNGIVNIFVKLRKKDD
ncbi:MAG: class I SAM-dependent methyltransferase [Parcubacteria group bacterium]|jgi:ubiquinone/menaquinone biosynthesis C-methylase UbiE